MRVGLLIDDLGLKGRWNNLRLVRKIFEFKIVGQAIQLWTIE